MGWECQLWVAPFSVWEPGPYTWKKGSWAARWVHCSLIPAVAVLWAAASPDFDLPPLWWTQSWDGSVLSLVAFAIYIYLNQSNKKELRQRSHSVGPGALLGANYKLFVLPLCLCMFMVCSWWERVSPLDCCLGMQTSPPLYLCVRLVNCRCKARCRFNWADIQTSVRSACRNVLHKSIKVLSKDSSGYGDLCGWDFAFLALMNGYRIDLLQ